MQIKTVECDYLDQARNHVPEGIAERLRLGQGNHVSGSRFFGQNCFPAGKRGTCSRATSAAGGALQHGVD